MMNKNSNAKIETTLEDLLAAAGEVAFEFCDNDRDGYNLARLALIEMIKRTAHRPDLDKEFEFIPSPSQLIH